jgi:hypothetical protein
MQKYINKNGRLKFNPELTLIGLWTTCPRLVKSLPRHIKHTVAKNFSSIQSLCNLKKTLPPKSTQHIYYRRAEPPEPLIILEMNLTVVKTAACSLEEQYSFLHRFSADRTFVHTISTQLTCSMSTKKHQVLPFVQAHGTLSLNRYSLYLSIRIKATLQSMIPLITFL